MNLPKMVYALVVPYLVFIISFMLLGKWLYKSDNALWSVMAIYVGCTLFFYVLPVASVAYKNKTNSFSNSDAWKPGVISNSAYALFFACIWIIAAPDTDMVHVSDALAKQAQGLGTLFAIPLTFMLSILFFAMNSALAHEYSKREIGDRSNGSTQK